MTEFTKSVSVNEPPIFVSPGTFKIDTLNLQINSLDKEIVKQDKQIYNLKEQTNEKIIALSYAFDGGTRTCRYYT